MDELKCNPSTESFAQVFEAPEHIDLREGYGNEVLGYDRVAQQFVRYAVFAAGDGPPTVAESYRFDPKYTRVTSRFIALACTSTGSCDAFYSIGGGVVVSHVPDEVKATGTADGCVFGHGVTCLTFRDATRWATRVPPDLIGGPIVHFADFQEGADKAALVIDANGSAFLVRAIGVTPFDLGATEPLASLTRGIRVEDWTALTVSGVLVRGTLRAGRLCVNSGTFANASSRALQGADRLIDIWEDRCTGRDACSVATIPAGIRGHGSVACGIMTTRYVFDARRIFSQPVRCAQD